MTFRALQVFNSEIPCRKRQELDDLQLLEPNEMASLDPFDLDPALTSAPAEPYLGDDILAADHGSTDLDPERLPRLGRRVPEVHDLLVSDVAVAHPGEHAARPVGAPRIEVLGYAREATLDEGVVDVEQPRQLRALCITFYGFDLPLELIDWTLAGQLSLLTDLRELLSKA